MKLPRALAGLVGPSTPELQKHFLRDLKSAFRARIEHQSAPVESTIDSHLQSILRPNQSLHKDNLRHESPSVAARQYYIEGRLNSGILYDLITRTQTKAELDGVRSIASKAGIDLVNQPTYISARYAARLLHLGFHKEVQHMIARHTKQWIALQSAHPLLVQYASRTKGIKEAHSIFDHLVQHDAKNKTLPLIRTLLREAVRHSNDEIGLLCLSMDMKSCSGQETGLARWLNERGHMEMAFRVLTQAEPARTREATVALEIARKMVEAGEYEKARNVCKWVESRYCLSVQKDLRELECELEQRQSSRRKFGSVEMDRAEGQSIWRAIDPA